ncbi:hypothetical protein E2542_SST21398 [Spatholobus suberectus]|nr:hypothetical protein E2542_SST21398 [Spatholobus suberectus]
MESYKTLLDNEERDRERGERKEKPLFSRMNPRSPINLKIVIQVHMESDKSRSKALKIAAAIQGVHSVGLEGESKDQVVVTGDRIDSVCLTKKLRKKFSYATLVSVADANASNDEQGGDSAGGEQEDETTITLVENLPVAYCYPNFPPPCPVYVVDHDPYPNSCSIL